MKLATTRSPKKLKKMGVVKSAPKKGRSKGGTKQRHWPEAEKTTAEALVHAGVPVTSILEKNTEKGWALSFSQKIILLW